MGDKLINWIVANYGLILTLCGALGISLEVGTTKLKPITWLLKKAGSIINDEQTKRIDDLEKSLGDIKNMQEKVAKIDSDFTTFRANYDVEQINRIRKEISDFILSLQRDEQHTQKDFERINSRIGEYHDLLDKCGMQNGNIDIEQEYINKTYLKCLNSNAFFKGE